MAKFELVDYGESQVNGDQLNPYDVVWLSERVGGAVSQQMLAAAVKLEEIHRGTTETEPSTVRTELGSKTIETVGIDRPS